LSAAIDHRRSRRKAMLEPFPLISFSAVIASGAKQSRPSLRPLDCRVASLLAMTVSETKAGHENREMLSICSF